MISDHIFYVNIGARRLQVETSERQANSTHPWEGLFCFWSIFGLAALENVV